MTEDKCYCKSSNHQICTSWLDTYGSRYLLAGLNRLLAGTIRFIVAFRAQEFFEDTYFYCPYGWSTRQGTKSIPSGPRLHTTRNLDEMYVSRNRSYREVAEFREEAKSHARDLSMLVPPPPWRHSGAQDEYGGRKTIYVRRGLAEIAVIENSVTPSPAQCACPFSRGLRIQPP